MPCPFTGRKMFCASPNFLSQLKNLTAFSAGTKTNFTECKSSFCLHKMFVTGTICKYIFGLTQKIWTGKKHFATCKRTRHKSHTARTCTRADLANEQYHQPSFLILTRLHDFFNSSLFTLVGIH